MFDGLSDGAKKIWESGKKTYDKYGNLSSGVGSAQDAMSDRYGGAPYNVADGDATKSGLTNYTLRLWNDQELIFEHWLPESFGFELASEWIAPYANTAADAINGTGVGGPIAHVGAASFGITPRNRYTTMQFWQGSSPVSLSFRLQFRAEADAAREVVYPILLLASISSPAEEPSTGVLLAPATAHAIDAAEVLKSAIDLGNALVGNGPLPTGVSGIGGDLHLQIGDFLRIKDVFIKSISPVFQTRFESRGLPIEADLDIVFETRFTPTVQDIESWFIGTPAAGGNP